MTLGITSFNVMTLSITQLSLTVLNMIQISITPLSTQYKNISKMPLGIMAQQHLV